MDLEFKRATKESEFKEIYEHNFDAFTDTPDFRWNLEEIKKEVKEGWELHSAHFKGEVIAALFLKLEKGALLTKNTALKMSHQGSGFSHQIKEYFEKIAKEKKAKRILHYCRIDNFRLYSLNESHGYHKTGVGLEDGQVVEWEKNISK